VNGRTDGRTKQQKQIADKKYAFAAPGVMKHHVVVGPDHADLEEAHDISEISRPLLQQRSRQRPALQCRVTRDTQIEQEQGEDDRGNAI
jgi:hypothetical protein